MYICIYLYTYRYASISVKFLEIEFLSQSVCACLMPDPTFELYFIAV